MWLFGSYIREWLILDLLVAKGAFTVDCNPYGFDLPRSTQSALMTFFFGGSAKGSQWMGIGSSARFS